MKLTIFLFLLLNSLIATASHIKGGQIYYNYLGNNTYKVTLVFYRDCSSGGPTLDPFLSLTVFNSTDSIIANPSVPFNGIGPFNIPFPADSCFPSSACIEYATYEKTITLAPDPGGYTLSYTRCCMATNIINVTNPENYGFTLTCHIPGSGNNNFENSSPHFVNDPPFFLCRDEIAQLDQSAVDADGDSLVYSLTAPFIGADDIDPTPQYASPPPYSSIPYEMGFSAQSPMDTTSIVAIDSVSGLLTLKPENLGNYYIGLKVAEFRNGEFLGEVNSYFVTTVSGKQASTLSFDEPTAAVLRITPNPTNGLVTINSGELMDEISVSNSLGQIVYTAQPTDLVHTFQLGTPGIYFITTYINGQKSTGKLEVFQ